MSELLKLKFEPLVGCIDDMGKNKVSVEYFNKHILGAKLDMRNNDDLGSVIYFGEDYIDVDLHFLDSWGDERFPSNKFLNKGCIVEQEHLKLYIGCIQSAKYKLEEYCLKKKNLEDCVGESYEEWSKRKPFEVTL